MTRAKILIGLGILVLVCLVLRKVLYWLEDKLTLSQDNIGEVRIIKDASGIERHVKVISVEELRRHKRKEELIYWLYSIFLALTLGGLSATAYWWIWIVLGWFIQSPW